MPNIIGYKDLSNLYIKPAAESTRTISDIDLKSASEPERVLNPIVSESYMRQYIEEHGGITPTGNIVITENGENINVAPYATATVNVSGGSDLKTASITIVNPLSDPYTAKVLSVDGDGFGVDATALPAEGSVTVNALIFNDGTLNISDIYPATASDNVNCTVTEVLETYKVSITDITQPASVTFTLDE